MDDLSFPFVAQLFEPLGDVVFCAKDGQGQYTAANSAFLTRTGYSQLDDVLGKTAFDLFPERFARSYEAQDEEVRSHNRPLLDLLERIIGQHNHPSGWFLTQKHPLAKGGILALSQDLHTPTDTALRFSKLVEVVDHIRRNLDASLRAEDLCQLAEMSSTQLDRRMRKVFRLSTKQFVIKCRLEEATRLLTESEMPLAEIALTCGFSDQSALTRAFRLAFQHTPLEVRKNADQ